MPPKSLTLDPLAPCHREARAGAPRPSAFTGARIASVAAVALTALAGCQTGRNFFNKLSQQPQPARQQPARPPHPLTGDVALLRQWLNASPAGQASLLASAEQSYKVRPGDRQRLRLALLLGEPGGGTPAADLPRAQSLLHGLLADPDTTLSPDEQTLARFELVMITRQLTLQTENSTLKSTGAQRLADLNRKLRSSMKLNVSLKRQLGEARGKLAAIANIEKSLEGKLGTEAPPK